MTNFKEELNKNGVIVFTNKGVSMMPLLRHDKDVMVIRAISGEIKKNDAVLFMRSNGQYILHRVTKILGGDRYYIIGDNCETGEIVRKDMIIGVLTEVKKDGKTIKMTDKSYLRYVRSVPIRRFFFAPYRKAKRLARKIYGKFFKR